tara:strand:+ start:3327 stop:4343 length:1017 start_codon:yes stop_codon:yes gene_type:complete
MTGLAARLAIRADGDARLGFGHVMRCAALAHALLDNGHELVWLSRTPQAIPEALAARIEIRPLSQDGDEAGALIAGLADAGVTGLIGDWQTTSPELCRQLRRAGLWLALIGNHLGGAEADLVIHQRFGPAPVADVSAICEGSDYILLAPGYAGLPPRRVKPQARHLLVSLGGSDTPLLNNVVQAIYDLPALQGVEIEVRRALPRPARLPEAGLLDALQSADLAILAAGTTLHEAAATGLPAIALPITPNQIERARQFQSLGLGLTLDPADDEFAQRLRQMLTELLGAPALRQQFSLAGQRSVDGHGAHRVAHRVTNLAAQAQTQRNSDHSTATAGPPS